MYIIHYRKVPSLGHEADWMQIRVTNITNTFHLVQLDCGTQYEIQMTVANELGESNMSNSWRVKTKSDVKGRYVLSIFFGGGLFFCPRFSQKNAVERVHVSRELSSLLEF